MRLKRSQEEVFTLWMMLDIEFMQRKAYSLTEAAGQTLELILWKERIRTGLERTPADWLRSDRQVLGRMKTWDSEDPQLLALEKFFVRLAKGDGDGGLRLLERAIKEKSKDFSKRQSANAKSTRRPRHPLSTMVDPIVSANPKITENDLFWELRRAMDPPNRAPCTYVGTSFRANGYSDVKRENLRKYLYRAKKKLFR